MFSQATRCHFTTAILKSQNSVSDLVSSLFKSGNKKAFTFNFVFKTEMMRYRTKLMRYRTEMMPFRTWMMLFRKNVI